MAEKAAWVPVQRDAWDALNHRLARQIDVLQINSEMAMRAVTASTVIRLVRPNTYIEVDTSAGNVTLTLPPLVSCLGAWLNVKKISADANTVTLDGDGAEVIDGAATLVMPAVQYFNYSLIAWPSHWSIV